MKKVLKKLQDLLQHLTEHQSSDYIVLAIKEKVTYYWFLGDERNYNLP